MNFSRIFKGRMVRYVGAMAVKIDLEKTYDSLDWSYIRACLSQFGFCNRWIDLVMNCITKVFFYSN